MTEPIDHEAEGGGRERGVALIMVAIFGIGALVLASTLLELSTLGVTDSAERHDSKVLNAIVQAGIAASLYEINHDQQNGPYDPDGDGVGALGCSGTAAGVPVTVGGQTLGRYRTTIEKDANGRLILTVVAVYPDFTNPLRTAAAQAVVSRGSPPYFSDRNALSIVGPAGTGSKIEMTNGASLTIADPTNSVPAINITDTTYYNDFLSKLPSGATVSGADPTNPGSGTTGSGTITNQPAGLLSEQDLTQISQSIQTYVNAQTPTDFATAIEANGGTSSGAGEVQGDATLPNGVYSVGANLLLDNSATISGSGTLIIKATNTTMKLDGGARIDWNGDVIIIADDSKIETKAGTRLNVTGNLAVVTLNNADSQLKMDSGSRVTVTGSLLSLSTGTTDHTEVALGDGGELDVTGLYAMLGTNSELLVPGGSKLNVTGSTVVAVPDGSSSLSFDTNIKGDVSLTFDNSNFTNALSTLGGFYKKTGSDKVNPVSSSGYWEQGSSALLAAQQARISAGDPLGFNQ